MPDRRPQEAGVQVRQAPGVPGGAAAGERGLRLEGGLQAPVEPGRDQALVPVTQPPRGFGLGDRPPGRAQQRDGVRRGVGSETPVAPLVRVERRGERRVVGVGRVERHGAGHGEANSAGAPASTRASTTAASSSGAQQVEQGRTRDEVDLAGGGRTAPSSMTSASTAGVAAGRRRAGGRRRGRPGSSAGGCGSRGESQRPLAPVPAPRSTACGGPAAGARRSSSGGSRAPAAGSRARASAGSRRASQSARDRPSGALIGHPVADRPRSPPPAAPPRRVAQPVSAARRAAAAVLARVPCLTVDEQPAQRGREGGRVAGRHDRTGQRAAAGRAERLLRRRCPRPTTAGMPRASASVTAMPKGSTREGSSSRSAAAQSDVERGALERPGQPRPGRESPWPSIAARTRAA